MKRRLLAPSFALAALLLAACVPVTTAPAPSIPQPVSQYCAPSTPSSASTYQSAFDNLRKTYTEWATADGAVPIALPDGRTLWMFGDTFVGKISSSGALQPNWQLVSNSAVVQTGGCFQPLMGGKPLARTSWIADPGASEGYWPASAVVNSASKRLYVFLLHFRRVPTFLGFEVVGTRIATFKLPSLALDSVSAADLVGTSAERPYGTTALTDPSTGYAYIYSTNEGEHNVARALIASTWNQSTWQYWNGTDWSTAGDHNAAAPMSFTGPVVDVGVESFTSPFAPLRVERYGDGYLGTAMEVDAFSQNVTTYTAPTPAGPWTFAGYIAQTPTNLKSYGAQTPSGLQGAAAPVLVHSINVDGGVPITIKNVGFRFASVILPAPFTAAAAVPAPPSTEPTTTTSSTTSPPSTSTSSSTTTSSSSTTTTSPP